MTTLRNAKQGLSALGVSLRKYEGEFRVCPYGKPETVAYYTDDLEDAYLTGVRMSREC